MRASGSDRHRRRRALLALGGAVVASAGGIALPFKTPGPAAANADPPATDTTSGSTVCPTSNPPNELLFAGGSPQTAQLDTTFASPMQVMLANTNGCPLTGITGTPITFTAPSSGASGRFAASGATTLTVGADSSGNATAPAFTANDTTGTYTITATSAYGSASFSLSNTAAGIPAAVTALSPTHQRAIAASTYRHPLSVLVLDANGDPVSGVTVTFTLGGRGSAAGGGGSGTGRANAGGGDSAGAAFTGGSSSATTRTNSSGIAVSPKFAANQSGGYFLAFASVGQVGTPAIFQLLNLPARGERFAVVGSSRYSETVGRQYRHRLAVRLRDANDSPVIGATVTFTLAGSGGGSSSGPGAGAGFANGSDTATVTTGRSGIAVSPAFTANTVAGRFTAVATTASTPDAARFTLTNHVGRPATIIAGVAASESTAVATRFPVPLAVTVKDAHGNAVGGVRVIFAAPAGGPSGHFAARGDLRTLTVKTDADGVAVAAPFTANGQVGGYVVLATIPHGPRTAFALVNQAR